MKKIFYFVATSSVLFSCAALARGTTGATKSKLIQTVSVEQGCAEENIKILNESRNYASATYSLDVCGNRMVYKQVGTVFMQALQADKLLNK